MDRLRGLTVSAALTALLAVVSGAEARVVSLKVTAPAAVTHGQSCRVTVRPAAGVRGTVTLQERKPSNWKVIDGARLKRPSTALRCATAGRAGRTVRLRVVVRRAGRLVARSRVLTLQVKHRQKTSAPISAPAAPRPAMPFAPLPSAAPSSTLPIVAPPPLAADHTVPATTRVYEPAAISSAEPGTTQGQALVTVKPGEPSPVVGGHVALGPTEGLPFGLLAKVLSTAPAAGGGTSATLESAPLADVFDDVSYSFAGQVTPTLVDENNRPVPGVQARDGSLIIRGAAGTRAVPSGAFTCEESGGIPRNQEDVWETGLPLPIELKIENTNVQHRFDAGSAFPRRDPYFLLQFSGEAVATVGVQAKTGFECQLSDSFRRKYRFVFPLRSIGPVPISIYVEPSLKFGISASGSIEFSQRHYFGYKLEKVQDAPLGFSRSGSADPVQFNTSASLDASFFAGGELSLMVGASSKTTGFGAGIYGAFGPEIFATTNSDSPGCIEAGARVRADFGVKLSVWRKEWGLEVASLTSGDIAFPGSPYCGLPAPPDPGPGPGPDPDPPPTDPPPTDPPPTSAGVPKLELVRDILAGPVSSFPQDLTAAGGLLFFSAGSGGSPQNVWRSDGTSAGTIKLSEQNGVPAHLTAAGSRVFFAADSGQSSLWISDGTPTGTRRLKAMGAGAYVSRIAASGSQAFFLRQEQGGPAELWHTDGTEEGTALVKALQGNPGELIVWAGRAFFPAGPQNELWSSDGTATGTSMVAPVSAGVLHRALGQLVFYGPTAPGTANPGPALWTSDGTAEGTRSLVEKTQATSLGVVSVFNNRRPLVDHGGAGYFDLTRDCVNGGVCRGDLLRTDGSLAGTRTVATGGTFGLGVTPATGGAFAPLGGKLLVSGSFFKNAQSADAYDYELWASDGTPEGTQLVKDILPGTSGSAPSGLTPFAGVMVFKVNGGRLWHSDGTASGTAALPAFPSGSGGFHSGMVQVGQALFMQGSGPEGNELWKLTFEPAAAAPG